MNELINNLDFLKGKKTKIGMICVTATIILNLLMDTRLEEKEVSAIVYELIDKTEVILSASLVIYGLIMKVFRKLK